LRIRHRIPSIFTLSMVDVLCCALGCVILLWLLNARQQQEGEEDHARETTSLLDRARADRQRSEDLLRAARAERDHKGALLASALAAHDAARTRLSDLEVRIRDAENDRTTLRKQLVDQRRIATDLGGKLKTSASRIRSLEADVRAGAKSLASERARGDALSGKVARLETRLAGLGKDLDKARAARIRHEAAARKLGVEIARRDKEITALSRTLSDLRSARSALRATLTAREKELAAARAYKDRWAAAEDRAKGLDKELRAERDALLAARRDLAGLRVKEKGWKAQTENRFAGIALTGKRVVFLVDMSGSMELVDEETPAPQKWVEVRNTVARLMRSLPDLEKFQVITFAAKTSFPLGSEGRWIDHNTKTSPAKVLKALADIKPRGGTNLYVALEAAFKFRKEGLDTVYLLSDGLPNLGPGLNMPVDRALTEIQRGTKLGKHIRGILKTKWNFALPRRPKVRINTIGFFYESPDLGSFLWALAREHNGSFVGMSKP
jgi:predicted  nucleic acid-binding Zn-ribbon protein